MTYSSLLEDVRRYLERGFTAESDQIVYEQLPRLVTLGERRIARELKITGFITAVTTPLQVGVAVYMKPDRWRDTVSMSIGTGTGNNTRKVLFSRVYEYLRSYWPNALETDVPLFYSDYDYSHWLIAPTPSAAYNFEVLYYERIQPLDSSNQTNWFTTYAPQALLYGSLLQAMPFLKNDTRTPMWQAQYQQIMDTLVAEDKLRIADRQAIAVDS
jgi:hypothetical protein